MSKVFQFETPNESTGFLLWKVNNYWQREIKKSLSRFDLTHTQFVILANIYYLGIEKENITQMDIANQIGIDKMLTSNVLKALIKKDLIKREEHKTDTRAKVVKISKSGQIILKKALKVVEDFDKLFFSNLANNKMFTSELIELLKK